MKVQVDAAWMDEIVREALTLVPDKRDVSLRMHPHDIDLLAERLPALAAVAGLQEAIKTKADPQMPLAVAR